MSLRASRSPSGIRLRRMMRVLAMSSFGNPPIREPELSDDDALFVFADEEGVDDLAALHLDTVDAVA